jgi:hypothetical protein
MWTTRIIITLILHFLSRGRYSGTSSTFRFWQLFIARCPFGCRKQTAKQKLTCHAVISYSFQKRQWWNFNVHAMKCITWNLLYYYMPWPEQVQQLKVRNLLRAFICQTCHSLGSNPQPLDCDPKATTTAPPWHP